MSFCPNCRSPLEPAARFCANCGHTLPAGPAPAGPRPFAGAPPGYGPPPAAPPPPQYGGYGGGAPPGAPGGYGAPPGAPGGYGAPPQPPAPGGYGPPPGGYAPPGGLPGGMPGGMPAAPPVTSEGDGGMKILGGCGIAGCLGAGVAVVLGVVLVLLLAMTSSGSSSSSPPTSGGGSGEVPSSGSVRDLIRSNVGVYSLVTTSPLDKVPAGVVDSVGAVYSAPDGSRIVHLLLVYPSESIAESRVENVWSTSLNEVKSGQSVKRGKVTGPNGEQRGIIVGVTGRNPESIYWSNRKLVVIVSADAPHAVGFEKSAPY